MERIASSTPRPPLTQRPTLPIWPVRAQRARAMPRRLTVRLRTLTPSIEVRILTGHPAPLNHLPLRHAQRHNGDAAESVFPLLFPQSALACYGRANRLDE
jgi:hypothetical protein